MRAYKAVLLDRDGVINVDSEAYIKSPAEWYPIAGSLEAIAKLTQAGILVSIVTNQSGISRGYYDEMMLEAIHEKLLATVANLDGKIQKIYYCPHKPSDACQCRKPKPGLIQQALADLQLLANEVIMLGDSLTDLEAGQASGCDVILIGSDHDHGVTKYIIANAIPVYADLATWVEDFLAWQSQHFQ